jgi:hypothetical protein
MGVPRAFDGFPMMLARLIPPLGLVAALLGSLVTSVFLQLSTPENKTTVADIPEETPDVEPANSALALPPLSTAAATQAIAERPLFAEGRRVPEPVVLEPETPAEPEPPPAEPIAVPETVQPVELPKVLMIGMMEAGGQRRALVRDEISGEESWIAEGEMIGGWILAQITQNSMRLEVEGTETTFNLFEDSLP